MIVECSQYSKISISNDIKGSNSPSNVTDRRGVLNLAS